MKYENLMMIILVDETSFSKSTFLMSIMYSIFTTFIHFGIIKFVGSLESHVETEWYIQFDLQSQKCWAYEE